MTQKIDSMTVNCVRSAASPSRRWAGITARPSAFAPKPYFVSATGLATHLAKRAEMVGIDTNVWPLGLQELRSG